MNPLQPVPTCLGVSGRAVPFRLIPDKAITVERRSRPSKAQVSDDPHLLKALRQQMSR